MAPANLSVRLAILGVGYMGGSLALAARKAGLAGPVIGFDLDPAAAAVARRRGIVDELAADPVEAVRGAQIVVLGGPVRSLAQTATAIADAVDATALVFDIGSVKAPVVRAIEATGLAGRFVGCHPLAGTEQSGPEAAEADLFVGKPCLICPGPRATAEAVQAASRFWQAIGSSVIRMDPDRHDAFMAAASHLPHVAAFSLAGSLIDVADMIESMTPPSSPPTSLRDTTRVAASNPAVWRDIFLENRTHLLPLVRGLERRVAQLRQAIEDGDARTAEQLLSAARDCRKRVVKVG